MDVERPELDSMVGVVDAKVPMDHGHDLMDAIPVPLDFDVPVDGGLADSQRPDDTGVPIRQGCLRDDNVDGAVSRPESAQVALAYGGGPLYLVWADEQGIHQCMVGEDGAFEGTRILVDDRPQATHIVTLRAGGTTWVAYGSAGQPIRVYQAHRPRETLVQLSADGQTLLGAPLLADAGQAVMVFGTTETGSLAWQVIPTDLGNHQPFYVDPYGFPMPDSVGSTQGGVLMRFGDSGQCVFITEGAWLPAGNVPCRTESGELVSSGDQTLLWHLEQLGGEQFLVLRSLYDPDGILRMGKFDVPELTEMSIYRGQKPLVGRRIVPDPDGRRGDLQLYFAATDGLWESMVTWSEGWPWGDARAIGFFDRPQMIQTGVCGEDDTECSDDEDCVDGALCEGASGARQALVVRFTDAAEPLLEWVPMKARSLRSTATIFDRDPQCTPTPEACDGRDQDCDGQIDDGLCCGGSGEMAVLTDTFRTEGPVEEFLMGDNEWGDAYMVAYRYRDQDGQSRWKALWIRYRWDQDNVNFRMPIALEAGHVGDCNMMGAQCVEWPSDRSVDFERFGGEGQYFNGIGGARVLVARAVTEDDEPPRWGVFWAHRHRSLKGSDVSPLLLPLECEDLKAVQQLRRPDGVESVVVVCPDRIMRIFADHDIPDQEWRFDSAELGRIENIDWATIRRRVVNDRHDAAFDILVSFRSSLGNRRLRLYDMLGASMDAPAAVPYPDLLDMATEEDLQHPIYLSAHLSGAPIRWESGQPEALFQEQNDAGDSTLVWRHIVTSQTADSVAYAGMSRVLFTSGPWTDADTGETGRAYWAIDTVGERGQLNLWATSPIHFEPRPVVFWNVSPSDYPRPAFQIVQLNEEGTEFEAGAIDLTCRTF